MAYRPLTLNAKPGSWRLYTLRKADPAFQAFCEKIFVRDHYTCQYCGFQARDYQEVVNVDHNYHNNKMSNMLTACVFCTQCHFLESVGVGDYGGGTLVFLPEITQNDLNSFCHVLFCAISNDTGYKDSAQGVYRSLKFRSQVVEEQFGEGTSNPSVFGQLLIDSQAGSEQLSEVILNKLRLLPARARFKDQIKRWAETALEELAEDKK